MLDRADHMHLLYASRMTFVTMQAENRVISLHGWFAIGRCFDVTSLSHLHYFSGMGATHRAGAHRSDLNACFIDG
jgi:hypothetical protein